ncbi:aldo/keto reductase [Dactylosporangium sp. NPDC051485]|uniref:aldo/keto reductase n=1 Tax=Dactylosporangium sp. NPDC051485 TaxID=3154846 RepID=UPI003439E507
MMDEYFRLGPTGLRVSPLGLGTMTFGAAGWHAGEDAARAIFRRYLDRGGNFVDTADVYSSGAAEELLGRLIRETGARDRLVLATKFGGPTDPTDPNARGNGRKHMLAALDASLRRLGTDHLDLYWLHLWDRVNGPEEVMATFDALVRSGKVRAAGLSNVPAWWAAKAQTLALHRGWEPVAALQLEYSLIERTLEFEHLPAALDLGLSIVPWSPLGNGLLTGKYPRAIGPGAGRLAPGSGSPLPVDPDDRAIGPGAGRLAPGSGWPLPVDPDERQWGIVDALRSVAADLGRSPAQVALRWLVDRPAVTGTLIGATTVEQLDANLAALSFELPRELRERLDAASAPAALTTPHSLFARFPAPPRTVRPSAYGAAPHR